MASTQPSLYRPLKVYAFDPTQGHTLGNHMTINVPYEDLTTGPVGGHIAVVDYDASNKCYYRPVDLDDHGILIQNGLEPSEANPQFHQQMVYAVASETIRRFEFALGRKIRWAFRNAGKKETDAHPGKLRIFPHAMQEPNAYYSRELRGIVFGYFRASDTDAGRNLPGQTIFTCLSHDIIAHEMTHALVDGQREFFMEPTGFDTIAFHEAFADIVALFQHFSFKEALLEVIQRTGGEIHRGIIGSEAEPAAAGATIAAELTTDNPMVMLAQQFGHALGMRSALRSAIGTPPNTNALETTFEPHLRGSILVAAVFDAFFSVYIRRIRDLMRIARAGATINSVGDLHPDLANRLADIAAKTAQSFSNICIRALDFCPPIDIEFGDFLRALITADSDLVPDDPNGFRDAIIEAFRLRGIRPRNVTSYAEDSLQWCSPEVLTGIEPPNCAGLEFNPFTTPTPAQEARNARILNAYGMANATALGLSPGVKVAVHSFHPIHRVGPDGQLRFEIAVELMQQYEKVPVDPELPSGPSFTFRGGTTLILNHEGHVRYSIQKPLGTNDNGNQRLQRQRAYYAKRDELAVLSLYSAGDTGNRSMNFNIVHRGY
jgi:hypothetical protein